MNLVPKGDPSRQRVTYCAREHVLERGSHPRWPPECRALGARGRYGPLVPGPRSTVALVVLLSTLATLACAAAPPIPPAGSAPRRANARGARSASSTRSDAGADASPRAETPRRQVPRVGCDPNLPLPADFHVDERPLEQITSAAIIPSLDATSEFSHGHVRMALPAAWFPRHTEGADFTVYNVETGYEGDAFGVYIGDAPALRPHAGSDFGVAIGPIAVRGTIWMEGSRRHLEAIGLLPCRSPRYVHVWMHSESPERLARMLAAFRTLRTETEARTPSREIEIDASRDGPALDGLTANDPLAREMARRALAGDGLRAAYPLDTVHPLADQVLIGRYTQDLAGVRVQVWVRLPVRRGHAEAPASFGVLRDGSLPSLFARLIANGCRAPAAVLAHDGVMVRCEGERELRVAADSDADPAALSRALAQLLHVRATLARWARDPRMVNGYPAALCQGSLANVRAEPGALFVTADHCVLAIDPWRETVLAAAFEGDCASVPQAPWSMPLRVVGRFDDVRGANGTYCRFELGWTARGAWITAVGDEGTASGPILRGPSMAVDRRAVNTAVAFMNELVRFATGRSADPPMNVRPSVLRALGVDQPGSPGAVATLRRFLARGGFTGAGPSAVLGARAIDPDHVEVTLMPLSLSLAHETGGWIVTDARPTEIAAPLSPMRTPRGRR